MRGENISRGGFAPPAPLLVTGLLLILVIPDVLMRKITLFIELQAMPVKNQFRVGSFP